MIAWTPVANLRGPQGPEGPSGPVGPPGPNTVPTQEVVSAAVAAATSGLARPTVGQEVAAGLDMEVGELVIGIAADSTGNDAFEWPRKLATHLASRYPNAGVGYALFNTTTQAQPTPTVVQASATENAGGPQVRLLDTFSRTATDLKGSTPDVGPVWAGSTNAAGDWTLNGTHAVRTSDATVGGVSSDLGVAGDTTLTLTGITMPTLGDTATRTFNVTLKSIDANNSLFLRISIAATTGVVTWNLFKMVGGTSTNLQTGPAAPLAANQAAVTFDLTLSLIGNVFRATIGASTVTHTLSTADLALFAPATVVTLSSSAGTLTGTTISSISATVDMPYVPGHRVTIYNGSVAGSTLEYQASRIALMYPTAPDLVIVASGHNYDDDDAATYLASVDAFVAALRAVYPAVPVVLSSQNPSFADGGLRTNAEVAAHRARSVALRLHAITKGYGYLPVYETFASKPGGGRAWVHADGIHMNYDPSGPFDGGDLWASVAGAYFDAMSYRL